MKKVLINGYFGVNFGDDLFFKILFDRYPDVKFTFYNNHYLQHMYKKYKEIYKDYSNVEVKKYNKIRKIFEKINYTYPINKFQLNKFNACIFVGGSIFIQNNYWEYGLSTMSDIVDYFKKNKKNIYILGSNFGPFYSEEFKLSYEELFKKCTDVCFRENFSYEMFNEYENIRCAPDIVFGLKKEKIPKIQNSLGISIIDISKKDELKDYENDFLIKIKNIIEYFTERGKNITLFSFCEMEGDMDAINKLLNLLDDKYKENINICNYDGDMENFLSKFQQQENIIGCRFHSVILSQVFEQGVFPLIYSEKTYNVLKDIKLDKHYTYIKEIKNLDIEKLYNNIAENKLKEKNIFIEAENQFKMLDKYLNEKL